MSTFHIIEDVREEQTNSCSSRSTLNNNSSSVVQHKIENKRVRTIGNFNSNGTPLTTTATASSTKFSVTSTAEGKACSLSMSLERKDIEYMPKKIPPCIIPAGQSTVIHLDNYTHFMAKRITTTKTAIKRSKIITEGQKQLILPCSSGSSAASSEGCSSSNSGVGIVDFKVMLGGVTSSYRSNNNKTFDMNKQQKMLESKAVSTKIRGRKNTLALERKQTKEKNNMIDVKTTESDNATALKSILKKPKTTSRRRKVVKPRKARTSKVKGTNEAEEVNISEETTSADEVVVKTPALPIAQTDNESKVLRPCVYTMQNQKCLSEMTCKFLHSDFPCKYYYLNLQCPQDFKCQFMHNGPLEPKLIDALRTHILELLTIKPSAVETHFIEQLHNIEDLTQRLQSFQKDHHEQQTYEIIEVMDDNDEDQVLVIDESSNEIQTNNFTAPAPPTPATSLDTTSNYALNALTLPTDNYDTVYQNFKETNSIIDEIDLKLQNLKTTSNMSPNEKIHQLQNIYELLKEQEKRLPIYENLNTSATSARISTIYNKITNNTIAMSQANLAANDQQQQQHIVLVNPEIVNEIQISESQDNRDMVNCLKTSEECQENEDFINDLQISQVPDNMLVSPVNEELVNELQISEVPDNVITISDDNDSLTTTTTAATVLNVPQESGMELLNNEKLPKQDTDNSGNNDNLTNLIKDQEINDNNISANMPYEEELAINTATILNNANLNDKDLNEEPKEQEVIHKDENCLPNIEINEIDHSEQLNFDSEQAVIETLEKNNSLELNENGKQEETLKPHNETLELAITMNEQEVLESQIEQQKDNEEETEEESPPYEHINIATKPAKGSGGIRLRSHTQQANEATTSNNNNDKPAATNKEQTKPIKTRRLRLPKPSLKTNEKTNSEDYQINADVINKLINSTEISETTENDNKTKTFLQDAEIPLTQNVILTKRFMKKAKAKLEQQSLLNETLTTNSPSVNNTDSDVEKIMFALHSGDNLNHPNRIENIDVTLLTQTSEESYSLNPSQDPLINDEVCENSTKSDNEISNSNDGNSDHIITPIRNKKKTQVNSLKSTTENHETLQNSHSKRRISFENPHTTTSPSSYKEQFNLGNPHVVLTKLKPSYLLQTTQKVIPADSTTTSTTTNVNPIVTSSSTLLADDNRLTTTQKRRSFTPEYDLDSSLKDSKCLKIDNAKSVRKVNFDTRQRTYSGQSNTSKEEGDFVDTDSSDEKLTIVDTLLQTSTPIGNVRKAVFEPVTTATHTTVVTTHHSHHQHVHKEQQQEQENESDLRQQIENVSNKSDLQLQIEQRQQKQQKDVEKTTTANTITTNTTCTSSFISSENSNNLPHKQYQPGNALLVLEKKEEQQQKPYENNLKEEAEIAMTRNPYGNIEEDGQTQYSSPFKRIDEPEKPTSNASDKYSKETHSSVEMKENIEYSTTYSSLYNKLSAHSTKCQINFENSSVNITPISSPTYGDDTIASPSPVRRSFDFRLGGEIDGRLTYPPMPYILHEIDLVRTDINKPICIDKLKRTLQLDPRIFRTHMKKQLMTLCKPNAKTSNALVPLTTSMAANLSHAGAGSASYAQPTNSSMIVSPYDPRNRTPAIMTDIATPTMTPTQTALTPYNNMNVVAATSPLPSSSSAYMHTDLTNTVPLALQYHSTAQPILQPQQQQTPNMFLYGCLQRSPWYQSLMSTMKIQINQSISQLVRALNNFHRERLLNPEMVFDVFKIDCAGEILEIMRNLGIFVDANGIINEQRHVPSFGGRSCCNTMPVNATYSFIQQVLTPNTHCTSLTTASSTYNAAGGAAAVGTLNVNEPFVSCYIKAPEPPVQKHSDECGITTSHHGQQHDDHSNNNNNNSSNSNCNRCCNNNNSGCDNVSSNNNNANSNYNNNNNNRRFGGGNSFKKPYDNNYINGSSGSSYQPRFNQRSNYSNNPRFNKPGLSSPSKTNSSPPNSPRDGGFDSGNSYGGGGGGGGSFGRGGRFNNNRRFNNFKNKDNNYDNNGGGGSSWSSSADTNDNNRYNNKFQNNNSPPRSSSPKDFQSSSPPSAAAAKSYSPPAAASKKTINDEENWDSDN